MGLWYLLFLVSSIVLLLRLIRNRDRDQTTPASRLPPGPWRLPIIGSMHHMVGSSLPHHRLRDLARRYGPVMHLQLGEVSMVVITSVEAAQEVLKTQDVNFASRPQLLATQILSYGGRGMAFAPYGDYWRQLRRVSVLELLSSKRVQSFRRIREEELDELVRSISSSSQTSAAAAGLVNLSDKLYSLSNDITARSAFGKKCAEQRRFIPLMREMIELGGSFNLADLFPSSSLASRLSGLSSRLQRCHVEVDGILDDIVEEHRASRRVAREDGEGDRSETPDLLDVLLRFQQGGDLGVPMTVDNVKAVLLDLFIGGSETTSTIIQWAMSELMRNPGVMKRVQAEVRGVLRGKEKVREEDVSELHYLKLVVKETLRLHPPIPLLLPREAREACEVQGYEVPRNARVIVNAWALGRDPLHWDDAESFFPERFDGGGVDFKGAHLEYIPFGAGRRMCPGMAFGLAAVELPLAHLLYHFDWELPDGSGGGELDMSETLGATSSRRSDLWLYAIPQMPYCSQ